VQWIRNNRSKKESNEYSKKQNIKNPHCIIVLMTCSGFEIIAQKKTVMNIQKKGSNTYSKKKKKTLHSRLDDVQ